MKTQLFRILLGIGMAACASHTWSQITYSTPDSLGKFWQEIYEGSAFPCEGNQAPILSDALHQSASNSWVLIIETPNYLCNSHHISVVSVSSQGHWQLLAEWEGKFSSLMPLSNGFIILSHWEIEGAYPQLIWSPDSKTFHGIPVPEDRYDECCIELIDSALVNDNRLFVHFYQDKQSREETWSLPLSALQYLSDSKKERHKPIALNKIAGLWRKEVASSFTLVYPKTLSSVSVKKTDSYGSYLLTHSDSHSEETVKISLPTLKAPSHH